MVQIDLEKGIHLSAGSELRDENGSDCSVPVVFSIYLARSASPSVDPCSARVIFALVTSRHFPYIIYHIYNPSTRVDLIIAATKGSLRKRKEVM